MPNRLASETSPYLRQHADNPVEWWPWGEEALATARRERKPILLSIGYSACHWCHVMAHESFEDAGTARVMNALYVNIKVDREERPDIDKVYQLAHQALARRGGGWPLTVFLTPDDLVPFFAGTYFPNAPRYGSPAFVQVLQGVRAWYDDKPDEVRTQNEALARFLAEHGRDAAHANALDGAPIQHALERIEHGFDAHNGGHIGGPKFPHASEIELLLGTPADGARQMARTTLARMAERGLTDHLGGGFFRYCVDERWEIPHFEKMLYDNAQLLPLYAFAAHRFGEPLFAAAMRHCAGWLAHELQAPGGAFWSSLDADSEGEEGRYYVWQREEVRDLLDDVTFALVERHYGLDRPANFEQQAWHLLVARPLADVAGELSIGVDEAEHRLADANAKLLAVRAQRVRPGLDDKILTSWNALALAGLARAAQWAEGVPFFAHAEAALDFLHANVWIDGRLYACHAGGVAKFPAYLDDHAFLLDALLAMLRVRWKRRDLEWAVALADILLERFEDREQGGFFFTAHDAEALPQRPKPYTDESLPAGNGIAARALLQLGHLLGQAHYIDAAERTLRAAWPTLLELPHACCSVLLALDEYLEPSPHLVVRHADHSTAIVWRAALVRGGDRLAAYFIPADAHDLPGVLGSMATTTNATAYLCTGLSCEVPITDRAEFETAMRRVASSR